MILDSTEGRTKRWIHANCAMASAHALAWIGCWNVAGVPGERSAKWYLEMNVRDVGVAKTVRFLRLGLPSPSNSRGSFSLGVVANQMTMDLFDHARETTAVLRRVSFRRKIQSTWCSIPPTEHGTERLLVSLFLANLRRALECNVGLWGLQ